MFFRNTGKSVVQKPPYFDRKCREAFDLMDRNSDGKLTRIEVIQACKNDERVREMLGLPTNIRQEDGTREQFEQVFQRFDQDDSKDISYDEFARVRLQPDSA